MSSLRRNLLSTVGVATLAAGCAVVTPTVVANDSAALTKLIQVAQGDVAAFVAAATLTGVTLSANTQAAIAKVSAAMVALAEAVPQGAMAVATLATSPATSIESLLLTAGTAVLKVLPGTSSVVGVIEDVLAVAPLITSLAQNILQPTKVPTASSANPSGAAKRLGIAT